MKHYDLCVIGAGPAGFAAAMRGLDLGKRVLLIEKKQLGGAGLSNGALSSKTFWEIAQSYAAAVQMAKSCNLKMPAIPFEEVKRQVGAAVEHARGQLEGIIEAVNDAGGTGHLDLVYGQATLSDTHHVAVKGPDSETYFQADHIILATGSIPRHLPGIKIDEEFILSSDGIETLKDYPKKMVVLGAGVIGCEYATIFALLGQTEVFLIDKAERILSCEDEDIVNVVERKLEAHGVTIHRNSCLESMAVENGQVKYVLRYKDGKTESYLVDQALVAVGRVPNTVDLGLRNAGVEVNERHHILDADKDTLTNCDSISAVGDLTADIALVNVAELEGRYAVERLYGVAQRPLCYENVSTIMFLHPEVAGVGLNETEARQKGIAYRAVSMEYDAIPRAIAMNAKDGFIKLLIDPEKGTILGMRALGEHASSTIQAVSLMIHNGIPITALADLIHPHPSITEGVQECARALMGEHIRKGNAVRVWDWKP